MNITNPQEQTSYKNMADSSIYAVNEASVGSETDNQRVLARQIGTSSQRGTQTITGDQVVKDPTTNNTVIATSGPDQTITITNPTTNITQIMIGLLPDGTYNIAITKAGVSVKDAFS